MIVRDCVNRRCLISFALKQFYSGMVSDCVIIRLLSCVDRQLMHDKVDRMTNIEDLDQNAPWEGAF